MQSFFLLKSGILENVELNAKTMKVTRDIYTKCMLEWSF